MDVFAQFTGEKSIFLARLSQIKLLHCLNSSFQYFYQYLMDSFVLKSISRNRRLRICFKWSLWKFPVKLDQTSSLSPTHLLLRRRTCLDQTRLTSVSSASCLTAPPNSSASLASLLKQKPLGCERIEESNYISLKCKYFEGEITSSNTGKVRATHLIITEIRGQLSR